MHQHCPGIVFPDVGLSRIYPQNENLAHVVGYVGPVSDYYSNPNSKTQTHSYKFPVFKWVKPALKRKWSLKLRGSAGLQRVEVNARWPCYSRELKRVEGNPGVPRSSSQSTVRSKTTHWPALMHRALQASTVAIDCAKQVVFLAVGSSPSFDPNLLCVEFHQKNTMGYVTIYRTTASKSSAGHIRSCLYI